MLVEDKKILSKVRGLVTEGRLLLPEHQNNQKFARYVIARYPIPPVTLTQDISSKLSTITFGEELSFLLAFVAGGVQLAPGSRSLPPHYWGSTFENLPSYLQNRFDDAVVSFIIFETWRGLSPEEEGIIKELKENSTN